VEFLNHVAIGGLEGAKEVERLLMNLVYAQDWIVEEDFFRFKLFIQSMRESRDATVIFRLRDKQDNRFWLRMTGAQGITDPLFYNGIIHDITEIVSYSNHLLEKDLERQTMIEHDELPVLLVDMEKKSIISRNTFAYRLFGYTYHEFNEMEFRDIYPTNQSARVSKAYETCLLEGNWEGRLTFLKKEEIPFDAKVKIKRLSLRDRNLLRISIYEVVETESPESKMIPGSLPGKEQFKQNLVAAMEGKYKMEDVLDTLLAHQYGKPLFEAVLYADIYEDKKKVYVYARGGSFATIEKGAVYDYRGTVSQAIRENRLPFMILEDTLLSTRPIDWALFIPHGVRSYFAKPFYHGAKLRTLLMFCSTEVNRYSEKEMELYELYYPAFLRGLKNWRRG
jgi:hypothetical protein